MNALRITFVSAIAAALAVGAQAADDSLMVTTLNAASGSTDCSKDNFGYAISERAAVVRGTPHHKIRIERNLVDVNLLDDVDVESCGGHCKARITRKGNFDSGRNGHLIDRKGFVEIDFHVPVDAPTGNATLVLKYLGGGRGEYKLLIVRNSRVDSVQRTAEGGSVERYILNGNNLNLIRNAFNAQGASGGLPLTRVSEADERLVLDRNARNCSTGTATIDLTLEAATACRIKDVKLPVTRDASCGNNAPPPPPVPPPAPPAPQPAPAPAPVVRLNLTPALITPTPFFRSMNPLLSDAGALRRRIDMSFCAAFTNDEERVINLLPIRSGINYAGLPSPSAVSADVLDGNGTLLQRRTADPITQGNGSDTRLFDNWTSRPVSVKVVFAFSERKRDSIGARPVSGGAPSPVGCYLAPSEALSKFDPPRITFRVNTGTPPAAETQTNDNEITL